MRALRFLFALAVLATLSLPLAAKEKKDKNKKDKDLTDKEYVQCATICMQSAAYGCANYHDKMVVALAKYKMVAGCRQSLWENQCKLDCKRSCPIYVRSLCKVLPNSGECLVSKCKKA